MNRRKTPPRSERNSIDSSEFEPSYGLYLSYKTEVWLMDLLSGDANLLKSSSARVRSQLENQRQQDVSHQLAHLYWYERNRILKFLRYRNDNEDSNKRWEILFIKLPRIGPKLSLFGHFHGYLGQLVLCQQNGTNDAGNWPSELPHSESHVSNNSSVTSLDPKYSPKSEKDSPALGLRTSLKNLSDLDATVIITEDDIDGVPKFSIGSTLVRKDLIPVSSLQKLGIPFRYYPKGPEDDPQQFLRVPRILKQDQLEELVEVTKSNILEGKGEPIQLSFDY